MTDNWNVLKHLKLAESVVQIHDMSTKVAEFDDSALVEEIEFIKYAHDNLTPEVERIVDLFNAEKFLAVNNRKKLEAVYMLHYVEAEVSE